VTKASAVRTVGPGNVDVEVKMVYPGDWDCLGPRVHRDLMAAWARMEKSAYQVRISYTP